MGIYSNGSVYGIKLIQHDNVLYEKIWPDPMTDSRIKEVRDFYNALDSTGDIQFRYYTSCSTTYDIGESAPFMSWWPGDVLMLRGDGHHET